MRSSTQGYINLRENDSSTKPSTKLSSTTKPSANLSTISLEDEKDEIDKTQSLLLQSQRSFSEENKQDLELGEVSTSSNQPLNNHINGDSNTNNRSRNDPIEERKENEKLPKLKQPKMLTFSRLLSQARNEAWMIVLATLALFLSAGAQLAVPKYVGNIIDAISSTDKDHGKSMLNGAIFSLGIVSLFGALFSFARTTLFMIAGERIVARVRRTLFNAIMSQEIGMFDVTRTGELVNRLASDTAVLKNALTSNIAFGLRWFATVVGGIVYLFVISWKLTLVMLSVAPIVAIGGRKYGMYVRKVAKETQDALARASDVAEESISNIRTVRAFSKESHQAQRYSERIQESYELGKKMGYAFGWFIAGLGTVAGAALLLVLYYGATLVLDGEMTAGVLTSFLLYTLTVSFALGGLSGLFGDVMQALGASERVFQLIDREPEINSTGGYKPSDHEKIRGVVEFRNVTFSYPSRPHSVVLNDVNLRLEPGTVTALVGPSGGGKTTIASLIERFHDPQQGHIFIDGKDVRSFDLTWLHRHIGLVSQEPVLFAVSLKENISYGIQEDDPQAESATRIERVVEAAKVANAHEFIVGFKDQYDTLVGERGVRLSGGQKQRVAIARAVLLNPTILLLDEATSALDAESEHLVKEALDRLMKGRTVLVIAHRLSTVKNADKVVVIDQGKVVEEGTHNELLARSGLYSTLVRRQLNAESGIIAATATATAAAGSDVNNMNDSNNENEINVSKDD